MCRIFGLAAVSLTALLFGCGGHASGGGPTTPPPPPPAEPDAGPPPPPPPTGPRALQSPATFASVVAAARELDAEGRSESTEDCLLRRPEREGWPWMLDADLAAAVRPLPEPPDDLDERLIDSPAPVLAITRWGQFGSRSFELALGVITNAPQLPGRAAAVVVVTNRGVYLRLTDGLVSAGRTGPLPRERLERALADVLEPGMVVYVTAEAGISLESLAEVLEAVPATSPVALGVALSAELRIPEPPELPADRRTGLCPEGLPPPGAEGLGELEPALIVGALAPLRAAVRECMANMAGARAAGGRVELMMRIGADGVVGEACLRSDEVGGTAFRDCLIRAAEATRFPRPSPSGYVDVSLPLLLQPSFQRAVCD